MEAKCLIIAIEGLDGSGKQTQVEELKNYYISQGKHVVTVSYPIYESCMGSSIKLMLQSEFMERDENYYYTLATLFALDRYNSFNDISSLKNILDDENGVLIFDRYVGSNIIYGGASIYNLCDEDTFHHYLQHIDKLEYGTLGLPEPNKTIVLINEPSISMQNIDKMNREKDKNENIKYLSSIYKYMDMICDMYKDRNWFKVKTTYKGIDGNIEQYSIQNVTKMIIDKIQL